MPFAVVSSHAAAAHAAAQAMTVEGLVSPTTALDGLVAGVLALALVEPAVLLGSCWILTGGTGEALTAIDGRARQPGLEAPRPRGYLPGQTIPPQARLAVPGLPGALAAAWAGRGSRTFNELARTAVACVQAEANVDPARVEAVREYGRAGASMLTSGPVHDALLAAAARSLGGVLTAADLAAVVPERVAPEFEEHGGRRLARAPRAAPASGAADEAPELHALPALRGVGVVLTCDPRGAFAAAAVQVPLDVLPLPTLGLSAPLLAAPVRRGQTRVKPGTPLPAAAPIALAQRFARDSTRTEPIDLALATWGASGFEERLAQLFEQLPERPDAAVPVRDSCGIMLDSKGRPHALRWG